jgi:hypothetical protein
LHNLAKLFTGDGRCICGDLSGDPTEPEGHSQSSMCLLALL